MAFLRIRKTGHLAESHANRDFFESAQGAENILKNVIHFYITHDVPRLFWCGLQQIVCTWLQQMVTDVRDLHYTYTHVVTLVTRSHGYSRGMILSTP